MSLLAGAVSLIGFARPGYAQQFTDVTPVPLAGVDSRSVQWIDYEGDGDLDIVSSAYIYLNQGNGNFTPLLAQVPGDSFDDAAWGDYDNDGDLDVLLAGSGNDYERKTMLYKNNGNGNFTEVATGLIPLETARANWIDYDNDGDLDIILTGSYSVYHAYFLSPEIEYVTKVYTNNNNTFTELPGTGLPEKESGPISAGDYDSDGDIDLLFSGSGNLYTNNGNDTFSRFETSLHFGHEYTGAGAWGDYDNDGDLDLVSGNVFRNDNGQAFFPHNPVTYRGGSWGDYDNDGDLDILTELDTYVLYKNDNGFFSFVPNPGIDKFGVTRWGDYDNDGDLDVLVVDRWQHEARLFRNNNIIKNTKPSTPTALTSTVNGSSALLSLQASSDAQTPVAGLTYNLYIGTTPGGIQEMPPHATLPTGYRRVVGLGNGQSGPNFRVDDLPSGTYYWSVQAVDATFAGSAFAAEKSFSIVAPAPAISSFYPAKGAPTTSVLITGSHFNAVTSVKFNGRDAASFVRLSAEKIRAVVPNGATTGLITVTASGGTTTSAMPFKVTPFPFVKAATVPGMNNAQAEWGDYDNDNDLDILQNGRIYTNNGNGDFSLLVDLLQASYYYETPVDWGDYDNDGDLDVAMASAIYTNNGNSTFSLLATAELPQLEEGTVDWVDYDNDGDLDLFFTGCRDSYCYEAASLLYANLGGGNFAEVTTAAFHPATRSATAWGDYDNDGDLDLYLMGDDGAYGDVIGLLYKNEGNGTFSASKPGTPWGVSYGDAEWGDYDNDGDLDLLITGNTNTENYAVAVGLSEVYTNNGNGTFSRLLTAHLPRLFYSNVEWGDYDNDGYLDILITGTDYSGASSSPPRTGAISRVYTNNHNGGFEELTTANLPPQVHGTASWADYDNDHDLDILLTGSGLYKNQNPDTNTPPTAPTGLTASVDNGKLMLNWLPATDAQTPAPGLSYNVYIGTSPQGVQEVSPHSNTADGYRRLVQVGNAQQGTSFMLKELPAGTYYWSVQAVDHAFEGSPFTQEGSFQVGPVMNVPYDLSTIAVTTTTAYLQWKFDHDAESFSIRYRLKGSARWISRQSLTREIKLSNLQPGQVYEWQVKAIYSKNPLKETAYSEPVSFKTDRYLQCYTPINFVARPLSPKEAELSWTSYVPDMKYDVSYRIVGSSEWHSARTSLTHIKLNQLAAGQTYEAEVRMVCGEDQYSEGSPLVMFTTSGFCQAPGGANTGLIGSTSAELSWNAVPGTGSYVVQFKAQNASTWTTRSSATNTMKLHNLLPGTVYEWKVRAGCEEDMPSAFTPVVSFTTSGRAAARVETAEVARELIVYPNPAENVVNIDLGMLQVYTEVHLHVYDAAGTLVYNRLLIDEPSGKVQLNLQVKGLYIARVTGEGKTWMKKFVVQ